MTIQSSDRNVIQIGAVINPAAQSSRDFLVELERAVMKRHAEEKSLVSKFFLGSAATATTQLEEFVSTGIDVIIFCGIARPVIFRYLKETQAHPPVVFCTYSPVSEDEFSLLGRCAVILRDNVAMGRKAAEFFLNRGMKNFAFLGRKGYREDIASVVRERAFRERLNEVVDGNITYSCRFIGVIADNENYWETDQTQTEIWLKSLPTPCAILVNGDHLAFRVAGSCRRLGINVPDSIEILGICHNCGFGEHAIPSISSIVPSSDSIAEKALDLAQDLVANTSAGFNRHVDVVGDFTFVERGSTSLSRGYGQIAVKAKEFIRCNITHGITVANVAESVGVSLRTLEFRVKEATGMSVRKLIIDERMNRVCELLVKTKLPITNVVEAAGCPIASSVFANFKKRYGVTMSEYRKRGGLRDE